MRLKSRGSSSYAGILAGKQSRRCFLTSTLRDSFEMLSSQPMTANEIKADQWYLCVRCHTCGMEIPLMESEPIPEDLNVLFQLVKCYYCEAQHDYLSTELKHMQARAREAGSA